MDDEIMMIGMLMIGTIVVSRGLLMRLIRRIIMIVSNTLKT